MPIFLFVTLRRDTSPLCQCSAKGEENYEKELLFKPYYKMSV